VARPERKSPLGKPGRKWEDNIKMDEGVKWIDVAQFRNRWWVLLNAVMNLPVA
jgi:hypothetical protein